MLYLIDIIKVILASFVCKAGQGLHIDPGPSQRWVVFIHTKGDVLIFVARQHTIQARQKVYVFRCRRYRRRYQRPQGSRGIYPLNQVVRTTQDPKTGRMLWEQFTTCERLEPFHLIGLGLKECGYKLNGKLFTQLHHVQNDPEECNQPLDQVEASLDDSYSDLFTWQKKTYNTLEFHNAIHRMRLKAPWVRVLLDTNRQYVNRKKFPKQMRFNKMLRMNSMWAYPPTVMNGNVVVRDNTSPNRKVFVMVIATPIMGPPVVDPMQDMFGLNIADKLRPGEDNEHIRYACSRSGSMVSDQFGDAVKVEPMETIEEEGDGDLYDPATGRVTRSKSKTQEPDPLDDANQEVSDFVQALQINREINKRERSKKPYERKVGKPPKVPKILTDDFGWAKSKTIMIRPTFRFWYKNQYKYKKYSSVTGMDKMICLIRK
ncbi:hypothetical protein DFH94DRAFT_685306 [Russula ochroleuca]|uniref:Uncharacterized protein n=1 Tax=Russula ochroleuca TaxID=152965 RepID=A0A9P5JYH9_9AGAM|nr:hypothetical protein DFH94DRAFT_685306 [Russula ochroleuca]